MRPNDKKNHDRTEWEKIKSKEKGKYLIHQARSGIVMGVFFGIIMHIFESGFEFLNFDLVRRVLVGSSVYLIGSFLYALYTWTKLEKKYSNL